MAGRAALVITLFGIIAASDASRSLLEDPKCPSEIAAAKKTLDEANAALKAADNAFATLASTWASKINSDGAAVKAAAAAHNAAFEILGKAQGAYNNATNAELDALDAYHLEEAKCASGTPPADCKTALAADKAAYTHAEAAVAKANSTLKADKATEEAAQARLDSAQAKLKADIAAKETALAAEQKKVDAANDSVKAAQTAYADIVKKCSGTINELTADPDCPEELAAAKQRVEAAQTALTNADAAFKSGVAKWNNVLNTDAADIKKAADAETAAFGKIANAQSEVNAAVNNHQNAINVEKMEEANCAGGAPPADCKTQLAADAKKVTSTETLLKKAEANLADIKAAEEATKEALTKTQEKYNDDVKAKEAALKGLQSGIDAAIAEKQAAQKALDALSIKCSKAVA
ncbi:hypothetical protein CYMTET_52049 [Cymbomonas tetramitiformis]|uniref:Uncharacterized protein n=1 Tax=Cymbomonas tetramitiformis TaxID=36881 RepID=A0AAE0ERQ9_9CHLO|nr:hypothetical protein CYMTET_52049 [Cymbomonas tetramitiformis]|eukprot:gene20592-24684_t